LRLTPLRSTSLLVARVAAALIMTLPAICLTFAVAFAVKGVSLPVWEWPAMLGVLVAGAIPFAALGIVIGGLSDGDTATGVTMIAYLTLAALGGLWMPAKVLPAGMRAVAHSLPSNRLAELGWTIAAGHTPPLAAIGVLAAWGAGLTLAASTVIRRASF
jgi:ABC-2 type transport system permease protein